MNTATVYLNHMGIVCSLGDQHDNIYQRLATGSSDCLHYREDILPTGQPVPVGEVRTPLPAIDHFPIHEQTRCNQLLIGAMQQILEPFNEARKNIDPLKIGVVLGTSTSGIGEGEQAIKSLKQTGRLPDNYDYSQQEMSAPAQCLARWLNIKGPTYVVSTACSSGAKALASARRLLRSGICDLVIAGGVDALCQLTVNGFHALESMSTAPSQPFSASRCGINIGEGAAVFLLSRDSGPVALAGVGESSDAHHMSAPAPDGAGAAQAMSLALTDAGISAGNIDYLNLHGTATEQNDKMEALAVQQILSCDTHCSSTKPYTGHTLGAAGAIEAAIGWLTLTHQHQGRYALPVHSWDGKTDPALAPINLVTEPVTKKEVHFVMSNSFAFGGNNISLIMEQQ